MFKSADSSKSLTIAKQNILSGKLILRQALQETYDCKKNIIDLTHTKKCRPDKFEVPLTSKIGGEAINEEWQNYKTEADTFITHSIVDNYGNTIGGDGYIMSFDQSDSLEYF